MQNQFLQLLVLGIITASALCGQTATGRIAGTVTDATGAVIPNVAITARDEKTGQERKVISDNTGNYVVPNLAPSTYTVLAQASGLGPTEISQVPVPVGTERRVNIVLQPAAQAEQINVASGELAVIDTASAAVGANVNAREVATLPLN